MNKFAVTYPYVGTKYVDKETMIKILKEKIDSLENDNGSMIAGKGLSFYCVSCDDKYDGTEWTGRNTVDEFLNTLKEYHNQKEI